MVDSGPESPIDRAREALQQVDNLVRVAASRVIAIRETFERRHLRAADVHHLDPQLNELCSVLEELFEQLIEAWAEFSEGLASSQEAQS